MLMDSFEFSYRFTNPGNYLLRQSIWVLGCRTEHEQAITVLPPLEVSLVADTLVCPGEEAQLLAVANRPAAYVWHDGQAVQQPWVGSSGTFSVTVTDGFCSDSSSIAIVLAAELLNGSMAIAPLPDTVGCRPYGLVPQSLFTNLFYTADDATPRTSIEVEEAGTYRIGTQIFGCEFWEDFEYGVDCRVDVYVPTSFSPNGDGINDVFRPFGPEMELVELSIYDRWGGLLHRGMGWDGSGVGQGVYLYRLSYMNLRSGLLEERNGEVVLVK
jgi:gliding motility-associated-like protein